MSTSLIIYKNEGRYGLSLIASKKKYEEELDNDENFSVL
jgi:hypothetical protein